MPVNVVSVTAQIFSVVAGLLVLLGAALVFSFKYPATNEDAGRVARGRLGPSGHDERVSPDRFIDRFAGVVYDAAGRVPAVVWIIVGVTLSTYVIYLFLHWVSR